MDRRVKFLDREGFAAQVIYPTVGLLWEAAVKDPALADALCRTYNTWALEICSSHKDRLIPAAHISLRDPGLAVREMNRVAKLGCHAVLSGRRPARAKASAIRFRIPYGPRRRTSTSRLGCTWLAMPITPGANTSATTIPVSCGSHECDPGPQNSARHDGL